MARWNNKWNKNSSLYTNGKHLYAEKADGTYDIKTVDTVEIPYKGSRTVSGTAVPIEPYNKNECDLRTTASFYCAKDYASKQIISITDKLHTHLVN